ncbi:MAG TPA: AtpZ/AtpI family protein [Acidimicrobiia bacterium]|nr:AtpZ/AtpI family protein [Acidimicrobiia bacterium]
MTKQIGAAIDDGWLEGGSFLGSILSGTLLGLGLDWWLDTAPWFVIVGIVLGAYSAFARLWSQMKEQPDHPAVTLQVVDREESAG